VFDCHTHVFPPRIGPRLAAAVGREFGRDPAGDGSAEDLLKHLDRAGLDGAICFTAALKPDQMIPANSWMISVGRAHARLIPLGAVHPAHPAWPDELDRLERHGIKGLKIHPDLAGIPLASPLWEPLWEAARNRFLIMIHMGPTKPGGPTLSRPRDLAVILDQHPGLRVVAAHLGGLHLWEETLTHLAGRDLDLDTSCCPGVVPPAVLTSLLRQHGPERIVFGSDYPLYAPHGELATLGRLLAPLGLSAEQILKNGTRLTSSLQSRGFPGQRPARGIDFS